MNKVSKVKNIKMLDRKTANHFFYPEVLLVIDAFLFAKVAI
jgi:hypothetical protein